MLKGDNFTTRATNLGVELSIGDGPKSLKPAEDANQEKPRRSYVYAHIDSTGKFFYVGKGEGRRAWSRDRHSIWHRYVDKHLGGKYQVRILQDNLSPEEAEEIEAEWMAQNSAGLVNWQNMGRKTDFQACDRFHKLRDANRALVQQAKAVEKSDLVLAVKMYVQAFEAIREFAFIKPEGGLIGQLLGEEDAELGISGQIEVLDRLTMCLVELKRSAEAVQYTSGYFTLYRRDLQSPTSLRIAKRIEKALARTTDRNS